MRVLVVGDVHGRTFWKKVKGFEGPIVFLGDYHDPYPWEFDKHGEYEADYDGVNVRYNVKKGDYRKESLENFKEIIEFAESNPNVTLLIGNHDEAYINGGNASRKDFDNQNEIEDLFHDHIHLFTYAKKIGNVLFTHAGVNLSYKTWLVKYWNKCNNDPIPNTYEDIINECDPMLRNMISKYRGGRDACSGPLWNDWHERENMDLCYQVFGHTQMSETGHIERGNFWACIDSRAVFEIDVDAENPIETLKIYEKEN